jgi:D-glycero-D-manno-heptose 1,7-bisphosphate phosphatase
MKRRAVFLDRDGVINALVFNAGTGCWESPRIPQDAKLLEGSAQAVKSLADAGYMIFVVSNQPNYAKGKASLENIKLIHEKIAAELAAAGAPVNEFYYCYHHPSGDKPGYSVKCECRKPNPYFLLKAAKKYALDMASCWFVGDRDSDIECGAAAGARTVLVPGLQNGEKLSAIKPYARAKDLRDAALLILKTTADTGEKK